MNENQLKFLYDNYGKSQGFADYNEFKSLMENDANRKLFFDASNKDLGFTDYNEFESLLGVKKKGVTTPGSSQPAKPSTQSFGQKITEKIASSATQIPLKTTLQQQQEKEKLGAEIVTEFAKGVGKKEEERKQAYEQGGYAYEKFKEKEAVEGERIAKAKEENRKNDQAKTFVSHVVDKDISQEPNREEAQGYASNIAYDYVDFLANTDPDRGLFLKDKYSKLKSLSPSDRNAEDERFLRQIESDALDITYRAKNQELSLAAANIDKLQKTAVTPSDISQLNYLYKKYERTKNSLNGIISTYNQNKQQYGDLIGMEMQSQAVKAERFKELQEDEWYAPAKTIEFFKGIGNAATNGIISLAQLPKVFGDLIGDTDYDWSDEMYDSISNTKKNVDIFFGNPLPEGKSISDLPTAARIAVIGGNAIGSVGLFATGAGVVGATSNLGKAAATFGTSFLTTEADYYQESLDAGMSPQDAAIAGTYLAAQTALIESIIPDIKYFEPSAFRKSVTQGLAAGIKSGLPAKEAAKLAFKNAIKAVPASAGSIIKSGTKEAGEEILGQSAEDIGKEVINASSQREYFNDTFNAESYVDAIIGGFVSGGGLSVLSRPTPKSPIQESVIRDVVENRDRLFAQGTDTDRKVTPEGKKEVEDAGEILDAMKAHSGWNQMSREEQDHAFALAQQAEVMKKEQERMKELRIPDERKDAEIKRLEDEVNEMFSIQLEQEKQKAKDAKLKAIEDEFNKSMEGEEFPVQEDERDQEIVELQKQREERGINELDTFLSDMKPMVPFAVERTEQGLPVAQSVKQAASNYLYKKYKELTDMKSDPNRMMTRQQIASVQKQLEQDIRTLEGTAETKTETRDQENIPGIPSQVREGQEPIQAQPVEVPSAEAPEAGRVLQAQEEVTPEAAPEVVVKPSRRERLAKMFETSEGEIAAEKVANFLGEANIGVEVLDAKSFEETGKQRNFEGDADGIFLVDNNTGKIYLNKERIKGAEGKTIAFHEGIHPVVNIIRNTNPKLYSAIVDGLKAEAVKNAGVAQAAADVAASEYYQEQGPSAIEDETVVETMARVAAGDIDIDTFEPSFREKFIEFMNKLAKMLGLKPIAVNSPRMEVKRLADQLSKALNEGGKLSDVVGAGNVKRFENNLIGSSLGQLSIKEFGKSGITKKPILDDDEFIKLLNDNQLNVKTPSESLGDESFMMTFPDDLFVGEIIIDGKTIAKFGGGVIYALVEGKKGRMWASVNDKTAKAFADNVNRALEKSKDGVARVVLVKGTQTKHATSLSAKVGFIKTLLNFTKGNKEYESQLIAAIKEAYTIKNTKDIQGVIDQFDQYLSGSREESGQTMKEAANSYAVFRSALVKNANPMLVDLAKKMGYGDEFFDANGLKKSPPIYKAKNEFVDEIFADMLQEDFLNNLPEGSAYAVLKVTSPVKFEKDISHPSYPYVIRTVDGSPVTVDLLTNSFMAYGKDEAVIGRGTKEGEVSKAFGSASYTLPNFKLKPGVNENTPGAVNLSKKLLEYKGVATKLKKATPERITKASENLQAKFRRDGIPLSKQEAVEIVEELASWKDWYEGIAQMVQDNFGEYAADYMMFMFGSAVASNSAGTIGTSLNNLERLYAQEEIKGLPIMKRNIYEILSGLPITSDKIDNFVAAGLGDKNAIPVDMHVWSFINSFPTTKKNPDKKDFDKAKEFVRAVADGLGWDPREVQAAMWAANMLRLGQRPDTYEEYIQKKIDAGLQKQIQGWRDKGYKPVFAVRQAGEKIETVFLQEEKKQEFVPKLEQVKRDIAEASKKRKKTGQPSIGIRRGPKPTKAEIDTYLSEQEFFRSTSPFAWAVDAVSRETLENSSIVENEGTYAVVTEDGDIKGVFNPNVAKQREGIEPKKGTLNGLIPKAIAAGGIKLDNFDGRLTELYSKNGFRKTSSVPFNEEYAPEGWIKEKHGTPDVVAMVYDPDNKLDIEFKKFDDYGDMISYRDSFVDQAREEYQEQPKQGQPSMVKRTPINWEKSPEGKGDPSISSRNPVVTAAAQSLKDGKITNEEYRATISENSPILPITRFFEPATIEEIKRAFEVATKKETDAAKIDAPVKDGTEVGLRLDIPSYKFNNTWVVSVHDGKTKSGPVISYTNVAKIKDVEFSIEPKAALNIAAGVAKTTIGRMFGTWESIPGANMAEQGENAKSMVQDIVNDPSYVQVGMNPFRHSYFYDRSSDIGRPIMSADEVIQIGGLVYAKNPVYGNWTDEAFEVKGMLDASGKTVQFSGDIKRTPTQTQKLMEDALDAIDEAIADGVDAQTAVEDNITSQDWYGELTPKQKEQFDEIIKDEFGVTPKAPVAKPTGVKATIANIIDNYYKLKDGDRSARAAINEILGQDPKLKYIYDNISKINKQLQDAGVITDKTDGCP